MRVKPLTRHALLRILGWALVLLVLLMLPWGWINTTAAWVVIVLWQAKDVLLYPLYLQALVAESFVSDSLSEPVEDPCKSCEVMGYCGGKRGIFVRTAE
jgi:hypothetical protein